YLGFPMLNNYPRHKDYQPLLDKMRARLNNWNARWLSMAGRCTLITSTLNTLPNHLMQISLLPTKTLQEIDKIQRDFLWGTTREKRKIHLIGWSTVTNTKLNGGLGIKKAKSKNLALLTSLAWRILTNTNSLWAKTLISIYGTSRRINGSSITWKSLLKGWTICHKGIRWPVDKHSHMNIWDSNWIPNIQSLH
ncbi:putative ribonuclease h protein, partial [Nicotiana attenuata]